MRLENALSVIEWATATILSEIINNRKVPKRITTDHTTLKLYVLSQIVRTEHAEKEANEVATKLLRFVLSKDEKAQSVIKDKFTLDDIKIKLTRPMNLLLSTAGQSLPLVMDLNYKVLHNTTSVGFITSDNPAVKYNQFCEGNKKWVYNTGFAIKGLQIFLPISPKYCLLFYDDKVYKVGNRRDDIIPIADKKSIDQINGLQVVNCFNNIYYDKSCPDPYIYNLIRAYVPLRKKKKAILKEYPSIDGASAGTLKSYVPRHFDNRINLQIANIRVLTSAKGFVMDNRAVTVRNKKLIAVHDEFLKNVKKAFMSPLSSRNFSPINL